MTAASCLWLGMFVIGCILFYFYMRQEKFFRCLLFTSFSGFGALGLLWLIGRLIPVSVSITPFSLTASGLLGIPGVLAMLIFNLI